MSLSFVPNAVSSVSWGLGLVAQYGIEAARFALTTWLARSKPSLSRSVDPRVAPPAVGPTSILRRKTGKSEAAKSNWFRIFRDAPVETLPQSRKKVTFADGEPEVRQVEKWIDRKVHQHRMRPYKFRLGRTVAFDTAVRIEYVDNWINDAWPKVHVDYDGDVIME